MIWNLRKTEKIHVPQKTELRKYSSGKKEKKHALVIFLFIGSLSQPVFGEM